MSKAPDSLGKHIIIDLYGASNLNSVESMEQVLTLEQERSYSPHPIS